MLYFLDMIKFGERLKREREGQQLTQQQLSDLSAVPQQTIAAIEKRKSIRSEYASQLAKALRVRLDWLLTGQEPKNGTLLAETIEEGDTQDAKVLSGHAYNIPVLPISDLNVVDVKRLIMDSRWPRLPFPKNEIPEGIDPHSLFISRSEDDGMLPLLSQERYILFTAGRKPLIGSNVLVELPDGRMAVRKLAEGSEPGAYRLKPLNGDYAEKEITGDEDMERIKAVSLSDFALNTDGHKY